MISLTKVSFGSASAVVTSLGLIVGAAAAQTQTTSLFEALLIVALADNLTDALSIHIYQESEKLEGRRALISTVGNFTTRLVICATFWLILIVLPAADAVGVSLAWGMFLLSALTWFVARARGANPATEVGKHLAVALVVIAMSIFIGMFVHDLTVQRPLELPWDVLPGAVR